ncbi:MAG: carboxypeptidase-like regulatory domain-containing protein, partial [Candidatus Hatepunaea meridiana]|nr:carboxypeptidase-like regulatory domain-containing protein [Candidatus Hatepunaea meridiana]
MHNGIIDSKHYPYHWILLIISLLFSSYQSHPVEASITVAPYGFTVSVEENQEAEVELVLSNSGEDEIAFSLDCELIEDEEERQVCPRRDDPGDVLADYNTPYHHWICLAWDPDRELMWGADYDASRLIAIDPEDGDIVANYQVAGRYVGMFYLEGVLYMGGYNANRFIFRYDTDGNALQNWQLPISLSDTHIASDGEYIFAAHYQRNGGQGIIQVFDIENLRQVATIDYRQELGTDLWTAEWVNDHPEGQLWITIGRDNIYQLYVDEDWNCEVVQQFRKVNQATHCDFAHDGENLWLATYGANDQNWYIIDDGVREFYMLAANPEEGIVPGNNSETIEINVITEGYEAGVYNILIEIELAEPEEERDDFEETTIRISGVISIGSPTSGVSGTVTSAANDDVIEGAFIELDRYIVGVYSDDEGNYTLSDLPAGEYELTFSAPDFLPTTEAVNLGEDDIELNVELLYAEFLSDEDQFFMALEPDM